jgi:hypothetical protein
VPSDRARLPGFCLPRTPALRGSCTRTACSERTRPSAGLGAYVDVEPRRVRPTPRSASADSGVTRELRGGPERGEANVSVAPEALELLAKAPDPDQAARLSIATITAALSRARRRHIQGRATKLCEVRGAQQLRQPPVLRDAYAAVVASEVAIITELNNQIDRLEAVMGAHVGRHRDAEIYTSEPGPAVSPV